MSSAVGNAGGALIANKNQSLGYPGLDGSAKINIVNIPTGTTSTTVALGNMVGNSRSIIAITAAVTGATASNTDYIYYWSGSTAYTYTRPTAVGNTGLYTLKNASSITKPSYSQVVKMPTAIRPSR